MSISSTPVQTTNSYRVAAKENNGPTTTTTSIEELYKCFGTLADAKEDAGKHNDVYLKIISGTKSGTKEKQLASQFITRFFKYFPKEMPIAVDAIFDLIEDNDVTIRKAAVKDLGTLCKDCAVEHLNRIADILTQLLQTDDQQEFALVQASLFTAFKQNPKSTLNEIFNQITTSDVDEVRKRAIKFLLAKVPGFLEQTSAQAKELEDTIIKDVKRALSDVNAEEFILFIKLLTALPSMNTLTGRQDLVNIIMAQSEIDKQFDANDIERLMVLVSCLQQANPLFSKNVQSTKFVGYYLDNVLSIFSKLTDETFKFELLKSFGELCIHYNGAAIANTSEALHNLNILFNLLLEYLPKPNDEAANEQQAKTDEEEAKFNFSYVECLMYAFHQIAKFHPNFLTAEENKDKLKDFRHRLQYFAKGTQNYIKELRNSISNLPVTNKENEENKIRRVALKVTTNIDTLIKDLFHNPPSYKNSITLSWKILEKQETQQAAKRSLSVSSVEGGSGEQDGARKKPERGIYAPPSGKYSTNGSAPKTTAAAASSGAPNGKRRTFSNGANQRAGGAHRGRF